MSARYPTVTSVTKSTAPDSNASTIELGSSTTGISIESTAIASRFQ
jgi:hypothetical protein